MRQINTFLSNCWWNYLNLKHEKEIEYLSLIAGSVPGWYIWLKKREGVYEFILKDLKNRNNLEISTFLIKYYPYPEEKVFESFATAEQVVRLSNYFDNSKIKHQVEGGGCACSQLHHHQHNHSQRVKGIPKFQFREKLNPSLFTIGDIKFYLRQDETQLLKVKLIGQDRLLEYSQNGIFLENDGSLIQIVEPGEIDRSIPAWELCWDLYDLLLKEVFEKMGIYPKISQRNSKRGIIFYQEMGGDPEAIESESVTRITQTHVY